MEITDGMVRTATSAWENASITQNRIRQTITAVAPLIRAAALEEAAKDRLILSGSQDMARQDWAYVCGKLDAATDIDPNMSKMPAGYQGIYCRGYDAQKGWDEGTTLKMLESRSPATQGGVNERLATD